MALDLPALLLYDREWVRLAMTACVVGPGKDRPRGVFITFEGIEGSGKTSQMALLREFLEGRGLRVQSTREPGGTLIADMIRNLLLSPQYGGKMVELTELFLIEACRAQHVHELIRPTLEAGTILLCDRFSDSTLAYQGYGRGMERDLILSLNHLASGGLCPDLTILLDCPVEVGLRRSWERLHREANGRAESRFEEEAVAFHERVRTGYRAIASQDAGRVKVVDGTRSPEVVQEEIRRIVIRHMGL